jgi:hypothetical protein
MPVGTSRGNVLTEALVHGKPITVGFKAYIAK